MSHPIDTVEELPPFSGFPKEGISFLKRLKRNNTRTWFTDHKDEYEEFVKLPMQSLIASLRPAFERIAPEFEVHPKRSLFRIYRDTRFSKDKTPYKTHAAAHFVLRGTAKGLVGSGYYVHIEPGECFVGAGIYMPDGAQLKEIRHAIAEKGRQFREIVRERTFTRTYGTIQGDRLKRMPKGFDEDHPMADWLKLKQFFVGTSLPEKACHSRGFLTMLVDRFEAASPFVRFLNAAQR